MAVTYELNSRITFLHEMAVAKSAHHDSIQAL